MKELCKNEMFLKELKELINRYSMENGSDTPDFILAQFLINCLNSFDCATESREKWYGRENLSFGGNGDVPAESPACEKVTVNSGNDVLYKNSEDDKIMEGC